MFGCTPLHIAVKNEFFTHIVKLLILQGADVNAKDNDGKPPLHIVLEYGTISEINQNGADVNAKDSYWKYPLHRYKDIIKNLISGGANVNAMDKNGNTPLQYAIEKNYKRIVNLFVSSDAKNHY